jgi:hypothetical protein
MPVLRRLYFYAVTLLALEVVLWGVISLLRHVLAPPLGAGGDVLARGLALILVGTPVFVFHWYWVQRLATAAAERASGLRALFLYGVLFATLIPVAQNTLALVRRIVFLGIGLTGTPALAEGGVSDQGVAIAVNLVASVYFARVLRDDWASLAERLSLTEIRRLYRLLWLLYGLGLVVLGVQQLLRFLLPIPGPMLGMTGRFWLGNGLSFLAVGLPITLWAWLTLQAARAQPAEQGSLLRIGTLFLLSLVGMGTVLITGGRILAVSLFWVLGGAMTAGEWLTGIAPALALALPMAVVWAYYGRWLQQDLLALSAEERRDELQRLYGYLLALAGLVTTVIGLSLLLAFLVDGVVGVLLWDDALRRRLAAALATLAVGFPLWLHHWPGLQAQARRGDEVGELTRRSLVRKVYLYLVVFVAVIGGMLAAVIVLFRLLQALLGVQPLDLRAFLNGLQVLFLLVVVLAYHFLALRADGAESARVLGERRQRFRALAFVADGSDFGEALQAAVRKQAAGLELTVLPAGATPPSEPTAAQAVVLPLDIALEPPESLRAFLATFAGPLIVVPLAHPRLLWPQSESPVEGAAALLRSLSEGRPVLMPSGQRPSWRVVVYVLAALLALQVLALFMFLGVGFLGGLD